MRSSSDPSHGTAAGARSERGRPAVQLPTLLTLLVAPLLLWRAGVGVAWLAEVGGSWGAATAELLPEGDEELFRRALGAEYTAFAALRDHVPPGARIMLVGGGPASALLYQYAECMLYPSRMAPVRADQLVTHLAGLRETPAVLASADAPLLFVLAYGSPPELNQELGRRLADVPWLTRVPVAEAPGLLLYRAAP